MDEHRGRSIMRLEWWATVVLIVVAVAIGGLVMWDRVHSAPVAATRLAPPRPLLPLPAEPLSLAGAQLRGQRTARVALIEWSEFECQYCGKSARELLPELDRLYVEPGKVLFAFRHLPLTIQAHAQAAAEAAECAGRQGRFWEFHDWAFRHQQQLDDRHLRVQAKTLKLDMRGYEACLDDGAVTAKVDADVATAQGLQISGTPTSFVGVVQPDGKVKVTERFSGSKPLAEFQRAIDHALTQADSADSADGRQGKGQ